MAQRTFAEIQKQIADSLDEIHDEQERSRIAGAIAMDILVEHNNIPPAQRRIDGELFDRNKYYAVPDDALDLIPSLAKAAFSVITGKLAEALPDLVGILYRLRTLRVEIDGDEAAVLRVLRAERNGGERRPLSMADIEKRLENDKIHLRRPLKEVLTGIEGKKTEKATLATQTNGRWTIGNI
jgi:hypothetical protein